jgi:lysozyme
MLRGAVLDISHHNTIHDWAALAAPQPDCTQVVAVIHKLDQGLGYKDPTYLAHRDGARAAGLLWGAYDFLTGEDPAAQAVAFVELVKATEGGTFPSHLLPMLDLERNTTAGGTTATISQAKVYAAKIKELIGRSPVLYVQLSTIRENAAAFADPVFQDCPLMLAWYPTDVETSSPPSVSPWLCYSLWQYTERDLKLPGVDGELDRSHWNGSADGLRRLWGVVV